MEKVTQEEIFNDLYMYLCHKYAQKCPLQAVHVYLKLYCSLNPNDSKIFAHVDDPLRDYSMVGKVAIDASEYITNKYHDKAPDTVSIMTGYLYGLASKYGEQIKIEKNNYSKKGGEKMKEYTNMRIGKKDFIKLMNSYLSEEEATKVNVNVICDDWGKDLSLEYYKTVKIKDVNTKVLVKVDKDEIISILSNLIPDYDIGEFSCCIEEGEPRSIFFPSNDYVFDGVEFDLKPKQKQLNLGK